MLAWAAGDVERAQLPDRKESAAGSPIQARDGGWRVAGSRADKLFWSEGCFCFCVGSFPSRRMQQQKERAPPDLFPQRAPQYNIALVSCRHRAGKSS